MTDPTPEKTNPEQNVLTTSDDELIAPDIIYVLDEAGEEEASLEVSPPAFSVSAQQNNTVVGHLQVSPGDRIRWYTLDSLSVVPDKQGLGIGTQLVKHALSQLHRRGAAGCTAIGDPRFFSRLGFMEEHTPAWAEPSAPPRQILVFTGADAIDSLTSVHEFLPPDTLGL